MVIGCDDVDPCPTANELRCSGEPLELLGLSPGLSPRSAFGIPTLVAEVRLAVPA